MLDAVLPQFGFVGLPDTKNRKEEKLITQHKLNQSYSNPFLHHWARCDSVSLVTNTLEYELMYSPSMILLWSVVIHFAPLFNVTQAGLIL